MASSSSSSSPVSSRPGPMTPSSPSLTYPVDPDAPTFVAQAILASASLGAGTGAVIGVLQSANPFILSVNMGINAGVVGVTFFGLREYLVSPLLLSGRATTSHTRRLAELSEKQRGKLPLPPPLPLPSPSSVEELRFERVLDSSIAGALTGGLLSGGLRGPRTIVPASVTLSLIASALQLSVNQLRITRLHLLARSTETGANAAELPPQNTSSQEQNSTPTPTTAPGYSSSSSSPSAPAPRPNVASQTYTPSSNSESGYTIMSDPTQPVADPENSLPSRIMGFMSAVLPVRRLSDDEYLAALEKQRKEVDGRLREIATEEEKIFEGMTRA
ncbi:hypothetical protein JCM24511_03019 [Saitozyma sp. JCM 24511]|nr:hypothetical protein JCM24511_03019 [Saitozyma sp. JCM 24511]